MASKWLISYIGVKDTYVELTTDMIEAPCHPSDFRRWMWVNRSVNVHAIYSAFEVPDAQPPKP